VLVSEKEGGVDGRDVIRLKAEASKLVYDNPLAAPVVVLDMGR
jgi:hypothetical protein